MSLSGLRSRMDRLEMAGPGDVWAGYLFIWDAAETPLDRAKVQVCARLARREDIRSEDIIAPGGTPATDVQVPDVMAERLIREAIEEDKSRDGAEERDEK